MSVVGLKLVSRLHDNAYLVVGITCMLIFNLHFVTSIESGEQEWFYRNRLTFTNANAQTL